ncbi:MAG: serine hydrolase domain-containing protein [Bacteroidota bacterium]
MKCTFHYFILFLFTSNIVFGQGVSEAQQTQIDALFADFDNSPTVAYGIIYNDEIISKFFGQSSRDSKQPEQFRLGGIAMHFTAYAILSLVENKQIALTDQVSPYLSEEVSLKMEGITVHDLLTHAHGLPEYWSLKQLQGKTAYDTFQPSDAAAIFKQPLDPLMPQGQEVSFSGTGAYLLARIVEKVSGKSFAQYTHDQLFAPLKMQHTYFCDTNTSRNQNIVSYLNKGDYYEPQIVQHNDSGAAGLIATMEDLLIWFKHLQEKESTLHQQLDQSIKYNATTISETPNGQITFGQQFTYELRGVQKIWDYGSIGGFASSVFRFPEQDLSIVILSKNGLTYNGFLGMHTADILLADVYEEEESPLEQEAVVEVNTIPLTQSIKEAFVGHYFNNDRYLLREIKVIDDTLRYHNSDYNSTFNLLPINEQELLVKTHLGDHKIMRTPTGIDFLIDGESSRLEKLASDQMVSPLPDSFMGSYHNEGLQLQLSIVKESDQLFLLDDETERFVLQVVGQQRFVTKSNRYKYIKLRMEGDTPAVYVSSDGYKNIPFEQINCSTIDRI